MQTLRTISTGKKLKLLERVVFSENEEVPVRATAKELGMNPGYVSTILRRMADAGMIHRGKVDGSDPRIRSLKVVMNTEKLFNAWKQVRRRGIRGFGVYGSWARGSNLKSSDLDVWIKTGYELAAVETSVIREILRKETGASEIGLVVLTPERIGKMKSADQLFYSSLQNSFHIGGEDID